MQTDADELIKKHKQLNQSDMQKVRSHIQREAGEWILNTLMIEGCDVPFKFKRKQAYKDVTGQRVNLTYYRTTETVAGIEMEVMNVVRIKIA
ncbi:MAG: hypothetical protein ACN4GM_13130 [Gammaproteobacteria bacterium]